MVFDDNCPGAGGKYIAFGDMDNDEWQSFLKTFEKLLPKAFEERKCLCLSKQRI